jgi:serine/threonine protein phosphatase PrpC
MEDAHIACLDLLSDRDYQEKEESANTRIEEEGEFKAGGKEESEERKAFLRDIALFGVFDGHGGNSI